MDLVGALHGNVNVVTVTGRIDQATANLFEEKLAVWLAPGSDGKSSVVLDFFGVDYISSVGLRVLMLAARQIKAQNGEIAIAALTPVVAEVFQISRFNRVIAVHADVASALLSLG